MVSGGIYECVGLCNFSFSESSIINFSESVRDIDVKKNGRFALSIHVPQMALYGLVSLQQYLKQGNPYNLVCVKTQKMDFQIIHHQNSNFSACTDANDMIVEYLQNRTGDTQGVTRKYVFDFFIDQ